MKILALEFSANERSVAVADGGDNGRVELLAAASETSRAVTGLALIDRALVQAKLKPSDVTHIVLALGPGSYTGIRSAIAIAQGWQLGCGVESIGLSSMQCLTAQAQDRGMRGDISFVIDAQRGEVYHQAFRIEAEDCTELSELRIIPPSDVPGGTLVAGPEASRFIPAAIDLAPSAETLATLVHVGSAWPAEALEPIYLRHASFVKAPPPRHIE